MWLTEDLRENKTANVIFSLKVGYLTYFKLKDSPGVGLDNIITELEEKA